MKAYPPTPRCAFPVPPRRDVGYGCANYRRDIPRVTPLLIGSHKLGRLAQQRMTLSDTEYLKSTSSTSRAISSVAELLATSMLAPTPNQMPLKSLRCLCISCAYPFILITSFSVSFLSFGTLSCLQIFRAHFEYLCRIVPYKISDYYLVQSNSTGFRDTAYSPSFLVDVPNKSAVNALQ